MTSYLQTLRTTVVFVLTLEKIVALYHCPPDWIQWNRSCYLLTPAPMLWRDIHSLCRSLGARMAVPGSDKENTFLGEVVRSIDESLWIDCTDKDEEGKWICAEDDANGTGYRHWDDNQPNAYPGDADYAIIGASSFWADFNDRPAFSICEMESGCAPSTQCITFKNHDDDTIGHKCLQGHAIKEITVKHAIQCCAACFRISNCRSFNLIGSGTAGLLCQLNNATYAQVDADYYAKVENCIYYL